MAGPHLAHGFEQSGQMRSQPIFCQPGTAAQQLPCLGGLPVQPGVQLGSQGSNQQAQISLRPHILVNVVCTRGILLPRCKYGLLLATSLTCCSGRFPQR